MLEHISQDIQKLINDNTGYKFNTWLNLKAKSDINNIYTRILGNDITVSIYSDNLFYALKALYEFNNNLHPKEYSTFLDTIIHMQITSDND